MLNRIRTYLAIRRVKRMEKIFDTLSAAEPAEMRKNFSLKQKLRALTRYYEGGTWLEDFERDERGEFPADLKRGVLSEDGIFNLLTKDEI